MALNGQYRSQFPQPSGQNKVYPLLSLYGFKWKYPTWV